MSVGEIISILIGIGFIWLGIWWNGKKDWKRKEIQNWKKDPRTVARITGTIDAGEGSDYGGYYYSAEIFADGKWQKARSQIRFRARRSCEIGEEVEVAYRPVENSQVLDHMMGAMTKAIMNEDWEERKPRYHFMIMDEKKYINEGKSDKTAWFFWGFGLLVLLIAAASLAGLVE